MINISSVFIAIAIMVANISTSSVAQDSFDSPSTPQQQTMPPPDFPEQQNMQQPGFPGQRPQPGGQPYGQQINFSHIMQMEDQDFGIPPTNQLHAGPMHGPTPTKIPGGLVISTEALIMTLKKNSGQILLFDVLGGSIGLPGAQNALPAAQPGSFNDQTQQEFGQYLAQMTPRNKAMPMVFYCQSPQCWMSYNAALRAINMGYTQVLWYRGGIEAWQMARQPTFPKE